MLRRIFANWLLCCGLAVVAAWLTGCAQATVSTPTPTTITIAGATSMRPVLQELTAEFSRQHPNVLFDLRGGGSTLGEARLLAGGIDVAATTLLAPSDDATPDPLTRTPIGLDGVAVVVHASNSVPDLSVLQLRDIYSGRILDWSQAGGEPGEIGLVSREDGAGARILFDSRVMGETRVSLTAVVMPTSADVVEYVAAHPQAIGYVSTAYVMPAAASSVTAPPAGVRVVPLEGVLPRGANLLEQDYWLIQPLYLATVGEPTGWVRQFIDFALSDPGQEIVARYHAPLQ